MEDLLVLTLRYIMYCAHAAEKGWQHCMHMKVLQRNCLGQ